MHTLAGQGTGNAPFLQMTDRSQLRRTINRRQCNSWPTAGNASVSSGGNEPAPVRRALKKKKKRNYKKKTAVARIARHPTPATKTRISKKKMKIKTRPAAKPHSPLLGRRALIESREKRRSRSEKEDARVFRNFSSGTGDSRNGRGRFHLARRHVGVFITPSSWPELRKITNLSGNKSWEKRNLKKKTAHAALSARDCDLFNGRRAETSR